MFFSDKSMPRFFKYIMLLLATIYGGGTALYAQEIKLGADFVTLFDNKEYATLKNETSGTLFSARLTPKVGVEWSEGRNELTFAVDMVQDFGHASKFLSDINVQLYYAYKAPRVKLYAGIFPRCAMRGLSSPLFFDRAYTYYNNRIGGVLARYEDPNYGDSYVEFAMDYTGMRDFDTREAFMIMTSGRMPIKSIYIGYDLLVGHYAKDYNPETIDGVVDNIILTPYVGFDHSFKTSTLPINLDIRLSYVQSLQRDRINENIWKHPFGGELLAEVEWYGVSLSNRLYVGNGPLFTYYDRYGDELYHGVPLYCTDKGIYDAIALSYEQRFFKETVGIKTGITMEYDGTGWGTRQWLQVDVALDYGISLKRKKTIE